MLVLKLKLIVIADVDLFDLFDLFDLLVRIVPFETDFVVVVAVVVVYYDLYYYCGCHYLNFEVEK